MASRRSAAALLVLGCILLAVFQKHSTSLLSGSLPTLLRQLTSGAAVGSLVDRSEPHHGHHKKHHHEPDASDDDGPGVHTPFRWTPRTIIGVIAAATCALLANAAGIGGGPFYVPLFNVLLGFDLKLCVGLSHSVVATGAIASCLYGLIQRSPTNSNSTLLNFDIALTLIPAMLFGVSFGVLFNPLTPEWLQTALLSVLLLVVVRKTYAKGFKQWAEEKKSSSHHEEEDSAQQSLLEGSGDVGASDARRRWGRAVSIALDREGADEHFSCAHIEEKAAELGHEAEAAAVGAFHRVPWVKLLSLVALWAVFLFLQLKKAQYNRCTWQFVLYAGGQAMLLAVVTFVFVLHQAHRAERDPDSVDPEFLKTIRVGLNGESGADGQSSSGLHNLTVVAGVVAASGFIAGLLGIGGALIFNPFLLALGVHPQVVASTAVLIILFGSSSISLSFLFNNMLNVSYVKVFAPIAFVSSLLGVTCIGYLVRKSGRASIIILLMATVIAAGTAATVLFGGIRSYHDIREGHIGFKGFCSQ